MQIATYLHKLWLYGCGVDSLIVEEHFDLLCNAHVVAEVVAADMSRGNDTVTCQLPDMELVNC